MTGYFITGTGTEVGKTLLTCALLYQLREEGRGARAIKPVISGFDPHFLEISDTGRLLASQGLPLDAASIDTISPWRFAAPLSPDMAAADEGRAIDFERLVAFCSAQQGSPLLVEGAGGVMTPLDASHTVLDWALALGFPVILVAGSYLGTLSHTLASASALAAAGLTLHAVVISESETSPVALARTEAALRRFLPQGVPLMSIARLDSSAELWKYVPNLTRYIPL